MEPLPVTMKLPVVLARLMPTEAIGEPPLPAETLESVAFRLPWVRFTAVPPVLTTLKVLAVNVPKLFPVSAVPPELFSAIAIYAVVARAQLDSCSGIIDGWYCAAGCRQRIAERRNSQARETSQRRTWLTTKFWPAKQGQRAAVGGRGGVQKDVLVVRCRMATARHH